MSEQTSPAKSSRVFPLLSWFIAILIPIALVLTAMRLLMIPAFLPLEYNMPNFPDDSYGFTYDDRLYWSKIALDYLLNSADISFLGDLRFADGQPVYNERELRHMLDVKNAVRVALFVWRLSLVVLVVLCLWAWKSGWLHEYLRGLWRGGWLTVFLVAAIILFVSFGFDTFFVAFHNVFFEPGTWMFLYSDTLIRLFPERFWQDVFMYIGAISLLAGLLLVWVSRPQRH